MSCGCKNKNGADFTKKPDEDCGICLHKHYSFALALMREVGYEAQNTDMITGNLEAAAEHAARKHPEIASTLRNCRHLWQSGKYWEGEDLLKTLSGKVRSILQTAVDAGTGGDVDVLIPLRERGSAANDEELRMALRSIARNLSGYRKVWVAGKTLPAWAKNVEFVKVPDVGKNKQERIHAAIVAVMSRPECAPNVIFWADDNILLRPTACSALQRVRNSGDLSNIQPSSVWWDNTRHATAKALQERGLPTIDYEAHTPVMFRRDQYLNLQREFDFKKEAAGLCYISLYCNRYPAAQSQFASEVKSTVKGPFDIKNFGGKRFLGYNDGGVRAGLLSALGEVLNAPCRYESLCDHEVSYPSSPSIGAVVGTYGRPDLVELQLHYLCRVNGLPVLVHDDFSPESEAVKEVCRQFREEGHDVTFTGTSENFGHRRGDLMAFSAGLEWAAERGFDLLYKISRRFIYQGEWVSQAKSAAVSTGGLTFSSFTTTEGLGFRTEFCGMSVKAWERKIQTIRQIAAGKVSRLVEAVIHDMAKEIAGFAPDEVRLRMIDQGLAPDQQGYTFIPWIGTDRSDPPPPVLWHHKHKEEDYQEALNHIKEA